MTTKTKATKGKTKARRRPSAAAREAAAARLDEFARRGETALAAPGAGRRIVAAVRSVSVARFSPRNQALLIEQTEERGMPLTAVGTYRQWQELGRQVRKGETGLAVLVFAGSKAAKTDEGANAETRTEAREEGDEATTKTPRRRFKLLTVFEASQTDGIEDGAAGLDEEDPAAVRGVLVASLIEQARRLGYEVEYQPSNGNDGAEVDHDAHTLTVCTDKDQEETDPETAGEFAAELAEAVAAIVARTDAQRRAARDEEATERPGTPATVFQDGTPTHLTYCAACAELAPADRAQGYSLEPTGADEAAPGVTCGACGHDLAD